MNLKKNRAHWYVLGQSLLCIGLLAVSYGLFFKGPGALGLQEQKNVDSTKTALVGTADALLGPFPTATLPTQTPSATATATLRISATPTLISSATPSPTSTSTRLASPMPRERMDLPGSIPALTSPPKPTNTNPAVEPTRSDPPATDPPAEPTATDPPAATEPPEATEPAAVP